jgi:hypothetical protein
MKLLRTLFVASSVLALSAATLSAQAAQQVTCKDGAKAKAGRGACSSHGGVVAAAKTEVKADTKMAKAEAKADAKVEKATTADAKVAKHSKHKAKAKA